MDKNVETLLTSINISKSIKNFKSNAVQNFCTAFFVDLRKYVCMNEIIFVVEESNEGGYTAKALGFSIFTEADTMEDLRVAVKDAIKCHFDDDVKRIVRLHLVKEEVFTA